MKNHLTGLVGAMVLSILLFSCSENKEKKAKYEVIPLPAQITYMHGVDSGFKLENHVRIHYLPGNEKMKNNARFLAEYIQKMTGKSLVIDSTKDARTGILLRLGLASSNKEAYHLKVTNGCVTITGSSEAGVFYGIQTLRKSLPVSSGAILLPAVDINDFPRFSYRGVHLDVSRHFIPVDSVKKFIDILALHNINRFHWHLTDDQGWRIEIKKYPKLTEIGSKRSETVIGHNSGKYDGKPYGGFYTQKEAKEVVAYAQKRYITVIPEIDMPGHMQAALAAYPELGCTGGPYKVWRQWGVSDNVLCAGNDKTLDFIDNVLTEIMNIFPSEYIHVGGDECPKTQWKKCPKCQAKIKQLGLNSDSKHTAEEKLQSFIISHAEHFLNQHGRNVIGWDEILEGGVAPNATVMSWRGIDGGIEAAKLHHNVIMTPGTYMYFDHYQTLDTKDEPIAGGGYLPLETVYGYEPIPRSLSLAEQKYIIGVQANLWTEYMPDFSQVEYMAMPRIAALSEVQWTNPDEKNYTDFLSRLPQLISVYNNEHYKYAKHIFNVRASFVTDTKSGIIKVALSSIDHAPIFYTTDGSTPTAASLRYTDTLRVGQETQLKAIIIRKDHSSGVFNQFIHFNKATAKPIRMISRINDAYFYKGAQTLVDGLMGNDNYRTGCWIAFYKNPMDAVIDLKQMTQLSQVKIRTCVNKGDWVFDARSFLVEISDNGKDFTKVALQSYPAMKATDRDGVYVHSINFQPIKARYVRLKLSPENKIPNWHGGKDLPAYVFVDEISVN